eukprot:6174524-Pleurochrysis_carterae.AAC.2
MCDRCVMLCLVATATPKMTFACLMHGAISYAPESAKQVLAIARHVTRAKRPSCVLIPTQHSCSQSSKGSWNTACHVNNLALYEPTTHRLLVAARAGTDSGKIRSLCERHALPLALLRLFKRDK